MIKNNLKDFCIKNKEYNILLNQYDYIKNNDIYSYSIDSEQLINWKCKNGCCRWKNTINNMININTKQYNYYCFYIFTFLIFIYIIYGIANLTYIFYIIYIKFNQ